MSLRQLRRLQEQALLGPQESEDESEEDEDVGFSNTNSNAFAFALLSNSGNEEEEESDEEEAEKDAREAEREERSAKLSGGGGSKKKKKKKKKKDAKAAKATEGKNSEEDLDSLLQEFGSHQGDEARERTSVASGSRGGRGDPESDGLLTVEANFLSPEREMRRIFGSGAFSASRERATRQHRLRRINNNVLFQPPAGWPKPDIGLSMAPCSVSREDDDGGSHFEFKWSQEYRRLQDQYQVVSSTFDPNSLVQFLRENQYHLDTLLSLFYVYTHAGDFATADNFLNRCIFVLESAFHPWFDLTSGNCRLSYKVEENQVSRLGLNSGALHLTDLCIFFPCRHPGHVPGSVQVHLLAQQKGVPPLCVGGQQASA